MQTIKNSKGRLTSYGLACGYIERYELGEYSVQLWHEGACFHVRLHSTYDGRIFWDSFERLSDARKCYGRTKRRMKLGLIPSGQEYLNSVRIICYPGIEIRIPRNRNSNPSIQGVCYSRTNAAKIICGLRQAIKNHCNR